MNKYNFQVAVDFFISASINVNAAIVSKFLDIPAHIFHRINIKTEEISTYAFLYILFRSEIEGGSSPGKNCKESAKKS